MSERDERFRAIWAALGARRADSWPLGWRVALGLFVLRYLAHARRARGLAQLARFAVPPCVVGLAGVLALAVFCAAIAVPLGGSARAAQVVSLTANLVLLAHCVRTRLRARRA